MTAVAIEYALIDTAPAVATKPVGFPIVNEVVVKNPLLQRLS